MKYPRRIWIITPDGEGEAVKTKQGASWDVGVPTGDLRFFGSVPQLKQEIRLRFEDGHLYSYTEQTEKVE